MYSGTRFWITNFMKFICYILYGIWYVFDTYGFTCIICEKDKCEMEYYRKKIPCWKLYHSKDHLLETSWTIFCKGFDKTFDFYLSKHVSLRLLRKFERKLFLGLEDPKHHSVVLPWLYRKAYLKYDIFGYGTSGSQKIIPFYYELTWNRT